MPLFITFEGVEGSGKTTQIRRLQRYFAQKGISAKVTREPGGSSIGEKIRKILLNPDHDEMTPWSELLLYEAARAQHIDQVVKPLLKKGITVLCDRFSDATLAYQGYGRHLDLGWIRRLNRLSSRNVKPDLTFLLDCPSKVGLKRALERSRASQGDRLEREKARFHYRVRKGYLTIARNEPQRVKVIDTREGEEKVFQKIRKIVDELLVRSKLSSKSFKKTLRT